MDWHETVAWVRNGLRERTYSLSSSRNAATLAPRTPALHTLVQLGQRSPTGVSGVHCHRAAICRAFCGSSVVTTKCCGPQRSHFTATACVASRYLSTGVPLGTGHCKSQTWGIRPEPDAPQRRRSTNPKMRVFGFVSLLLRSNARPGSTTFV